MLPRDLVDWLLATGEPSVTLRVLRELEGRSANDREVVSAREEIGSKGWAAGLLGLQLPDGQWASPGTGMEELYRPKYSATNWSLLELAELGATRSDPRVARGAELLLARASDPSDDGLGGGGSEVCFTGNCARMMTLFGYRDDARVRRAFDWLVAAQKSDGGWHCFPSPTGTLDAWEALAAFAVLPEAERTGPIARAVDRGLEFFLGRGLLREGSDDYAPWTRLHYPVHYYYDALVGLEIVTALGRGNDRRAAPALDWLESRRRADGRWNLDALHPDIDGNEEYIDRGVRPPIFAVGFEFPGRASRWVTLRALSVLKQAGRL